MGIFDDLRSVVGLGNPQAPTPPVAPRTFSDRLSNPLTQAGLALLSNHGTRKSDRGMFEGVGEAATRAATYQDAKAEKNKTLEYLRQNFPDIARQVDAGLDVGDAFNMAMRERQFAQELSQRERLAGASRGDSMTADMKNFQLAQANPEYARFLGIGQREAPKIETYYDETTGQERRGYWDTSTGAMVPIGGAKAARDSQGITIGPDGTVQIGGTGMKLTEGQSKDLNYYQRGQAALPTIEQQEAALSSGTQRFLDGIPVGGNYLTSEQYQVGNQAGREFLAAVLRKDTGAAITREEFELYGPMFLPQPGDQPAVIEQKRSARTRALEAMRLGLGSATPLSDVPVTANPVNVPNYRDKYGLE